MPRRRDVQAICDKQGKMYVFGGVDDFTSNQKFVHNRMDIFILLDYYTVGVLEILLYQVAEDMVTLLYY